MLLELQLGWPACGGGLGWRVGLEGEGGGRGRAWCGPGGRRVDPEVFPFRSRSQNVAALPLALQSDLCSCVTGQHAFLSDVRY